MVAISIIIPVYNGEKYIKRCIESILKQNFNDFEILIIDDGSKDNSLKILKSYKKLDKIKIFSQKNKGPSEARNKGLEEAKGNYIIFIDIDDWIEENYLNNLYNTITKENLDIVMTGYRDISKYGLIEINDFYIKKNLLNIEETIELLFKGTAGVPWGKIFKKDIIINNKLKMDKELFMCEDQIFVLQYIFNCKTIGVLQDNEYNYNRLNEKSISNKFGVEYYNNFMIYIDKLEKIFEYYNLDNGIRERIIVERKIQIYENLIYRLYFNKLWRTTYLLKELKFFSEEVSKKISKKTNNEIIENLRNKKLIKLHMFFIVKTLKRKMIDFFKLKVIGGVKI